MSSREHDVSALRRERQMVLDEYLDLVETSLDEVLREHGKATLPRPDLRRGLPTTGVMSHLLGQSHAQSAVQPKRGETGRRVAKQRLRWVPEAARNESCGWGRVL